MLDSVACMWEPLVNESAAHHGLGTAGTAESKPIRRHWSYVRALLCAPLCSYSTYNAHIPTLRSPTKCLKGANSFRICDTEQAIWSNQKGAQKEK